MKEKINKFSNIKIKNKKKRKIINWVERQKYNRQMGNNYNREKSPINHNVSKEQHK